MIKDFNFKNFKVAYIYNTDTIICKFYDLEILFDFIKEYWFDREFTIRLLDIHRNYVEYSIFEFERNFDLIKVGKDNIVYKVVS